jgi:hypothetical protein
VVLLLGCAMIARIPGNRPENNTDAVQLFLFSEPP